MISTPADLKADYFHVEWHLLLSEKALNELLPAEKVAELKAIWDARRSSLEEMKRIELGRDANRPITLRGKIERNPERTN